MKTSASVISIVYGTSVGVNWPLESSPLSYPYGESMSDFYSHRQQLLNYEKKWKAYRLPYLPSNVFFSLPLPLLYYVHLVLVPQSKSPALAEKRPS